MREQLRESQRRAEFTGAIASLLQKYLKLKIFDYVGLFIHFILAEIKECARAQY